MLEISRKQIYRSQVSSFTDAFAAGSKSLESYLAHAHSVQRDLREAFLPFANPADMFRSELDEIHSGGAGLLRFEGRPCVFGMMRSWEPNMHALPHFDIISEFSKALSEDYMFSDQFGVNLYLEGPVGSGELLIWNITLGELRNRQVPALSGTYGYSGGLLPEPDLKLAPRRGDLVIIRSTRLHSVLRTLQGRRVSISGFMGRGTGHVPLRLWS